MGDGIKPMVTAPRKTKTRLPPESFTIPHTIKKTWLALNPRQRAFVLAYFANGRNATRAYQAAGYVVQNDAIAASSAQRLLNAEKVSQVIYAILKAHRLTPEYADLKHVEALEATETKFFAHEGMVMDSRECVAWGPRLQALDMLHKIHRRYGKNGNGNGGDTHVHYTTILTDGVTPEQLATRLAARLRSRLMPPAQNALAD